jgi:hypothetical protein
MRTSAKQSTRRQSSGRRNVSKRQKVKTVEPTPVIQTKKCRCVTEDVGRFIGIICTCSLEQFIQSDGRHSLYLYVPFLKNIEEKQENKDLATKFGRNHMNMDLCVTINNLLLNLINTAEEDLLVYITVISYIDFHIRNPTLFNNTNKYQSYIYDMVRSLTKENTNKYCDYLGIENPLSTWKQIIELVTLDKDKSKKNKINKNRFE